MSRCYICGGEAKASCSECGKPICQEHSKLVVFPGSCDEVFAEIMCTKCYEKHPFNPDNW